LFIFFCRRIQIQLALRRLQGTNVPEGGKPDQELLDALDATTKKLEALINLVPTA
jgi:hypothetical protein